MEIEGSDQIGSFKVDHAGLSRKGKLPDAIHDLESATAHGWNPCAIVEPGSFHSIGNALSLHS